MGAVDPSHQPVWRDYSWYEEQVFSDNDLYFDGLLKAINRAEQRIVVATYIFQYDGLGQQVIEHLRRARQRGVAVQVLIDGVGSMESASVIVDELEAAAIPVRIYHPLPWQPQSYRRALRRGNWLGNALARLLRTNQRHHAKLVVIDSTYLWSGSLNIAQNHLSKSRGGQGWHDLGVMVSGSEIADIVNTFDDLWYYRKPRLGRGLFQYYWNNLSRFTRQKKNKLLAQRIAQAKDRVWIINPYFSPTRHILRALKQAAQGGADVRIIVPAKSDIGFFPLLTATYYGELLQHHVRLFEYTPSILHAKLLMADDFILVGSTNLNHRSLLHDLEFDLVLDSNQSQKQLTDLVLQDQSQSREVTEEYLKKLGTRRLLGWIPWLLRYWL